MIAELSASGAFDRPVVTQVEPLTAFYPAEPEHQGYYRRNPEQAYCQAMIAPKMAKLRQHYAAQLQTQE